MVWDTIDWSAARGLWSSRQHTPRKPASNGLGAVREPKLPMRRKRVWNVLLGKDVSRYRESYQGCLINVVTERVDASGIEPMRRVKTVLITRNAVNLGYQAPPYAGPDEQEVVERAFNEARGFISQKK